jgi:iron-sulfur cluster assembly protein
MSITITENAANQIRKQIVKRGTGLGLRLGVKESGCTGFAYVLDYADELKEGDSAFEQSGIKVIINDQDMKFLQDIEVDYRTDGINAAFKFNNPNIKDSCGCGESFSV